jgi:hypothetical protein
MFIQHGIPLDTDEVGSRRVGHHQLVEADGLLLIALCRRGQAGLDRVGIEGGYRVWGGLGIGWSGVWDCLMILFIFTVFSPAVDCKVPPGLIPARYSFPFKPRLICWAFYLIPCIALSGWQNHKAVDQAGNSLRYWPVSAFSCKALF